jgi:YidC/Oxa1 family membrane protein insertase
LISVLQTVAFRFFLNEEQLLAQLEANKSKAKPAKKKSGFMARLEEAQRQQQAMLREQQKKQGKRK